MMPQEKGSVRSLGKALELLELLNRSRVPMTLQALSQASGYPKSTIHSLLATLRSYGCIRQESDGRYYLGTKLFEWGCGGLLRCMRRRFQGSRSRCLRGEGLLRRHRICRRCNQTHAVFRRTISSFAAAFCEYNFPCASAQTGAGRATGPWRRTARPTRTPCGSQKTYARSAF